MSDDPLLATQRDADNLAGALGVILDAVDYTRGACRPNELVGAVLPAEVIALCHERLAAHRKLKGQGA